ncbi:MAG: hypothetical protein ACFB0B_15345 [Thermonemataceae bacterium]
MSKELKGLENRLKQLENELKQAPKDKKEAKEKEIEQVKAQIESIKKADETQEPEADNEPQENKKEAKEKELKGLKKYEWTKQYKAHRNVVYGSMVYNDDNLTDAIVEKMIKVAPQFKHAFKLKGKK